MAVFGRRLREDLHRIALEQMQAKWPRLDGELLKEGYRRIDGVVRPIADLVEVDGVWMSKEDAENVRR